MKITITVILCAFLQGSIFAGSLEVLLPDKSQEVGYHVLQYSDKKLSLLADKVNVVLNNKPKWLLETLKELSPGEALPYDKRLRVTEKEWRYIIENGKKSNALFLKKVAVAKITVKKSWGKYHINLIPKTELIDRLTFSKKQGALEIKGLGKSMNYKNFSNNPSPMGNAVGYRWKLKTSSSETEVYVSRDIDSNTCWLTIYARKDEEKLQKEEFSISYVCPKIDKKIFQNSGTNSDYQHDMDIMRLRDLKILGNYIEEFKKKKGYYPLANNIKQKVYVQIATKEQMKTATKAQPPQMKLDIKSGKIKLVETSLFFKELEVGLNRKIEWVFDLQRRAVNRPNIYIYSVDQRRYNLAVHTFTNYPFSRKLGNYYHKVAISNDPNEKIKIWKYNTLMKNKAFRKAVKEPLNKPSYIPHLRGKIIKEVGI